MALGDLRATDARPARHAGRTLLAVQSLGKEARDGCFSHPSCPRKQIRLRNTLRRHGVDQCLDDVRLADHIIECPGPVFSRGDLIIHSWRSLTWQDVQNDFILTHSPQRAETRLSPGKAAGTETCEAYG